MREYERFLAQYDRLGGETREAKVMAYLTNRFNGEYASGKKLKATTVSKILGKIKEVCKAMGNPLEDNPMFERLIKGFRQQEDPQPTQVQSLPDYTKLLKWKTTLPWDMSDPMIADYLEQKVEGDLMTLFAMALPMRPSCVAKIVYRTLKFDKDSIKFNIRDCKHNRERLSPCFTIRDRHMVRILQMYLFATKGRRKECQHQEESNPYQCRFLCDKNDCRQGYYLFTPKIREGRTTVCYSAEYVSKLLKTKLDIAGCNDGECKYTGKYFRKTTATYLLCATNDIEFVTSAGGWKNQATVREFYIKQNLQVDVEKLRNAIQVEGEEDDKCIVLRLPASDGGG